MKLARFSNSERRSYGVLEENRIICLPILAKTLGHPFPSTLEALISQGVKEARIGHLIQTASKAEIEAAAFPPRDVRLLAPIEKPPKIICLGLNYKDHAAEQGKSPPDEPIIFMKPHTTIVGPRRKHRQALLRGAA